MTKYVCECFDGARKCTHETTGSCPTLCCVRSGGPANWRKVEEQKPNLPEWCKIGAWCYIHSGGLGSGKYQKIEEIRTGFVKTEYLVPFENILEARIRPWNDEELKRKVGKVFEMQNGDLMFCLGFTSSIVGSLYFSGKSPCAYTAKLLAESEWKLDGSPCGVLEHKNEQGEWVE